MLGILALGACATRTAPPEPAGRPDDDVKIVAGELGARLDGWLGRVERFGLAGVVLVAQDDQVVLRAAYGPAVRDPLAPLRPDTPMALGSLSKPFTATAVLALAGQGKLSLADPLSRFFPDAPEATRGVTVEQLLLHTSGLPYLAPDFFADVPRADAMAQALGLPLVNPGTYAYSSPGYTLLAGVIEAATGRSYEDVVRDTILVPAELGGTGFLGEARWASAPPVHSYSDATDEGALSAFPPIPKGVGAGSLVSTVDDLYRWHRALRDGRILAPELVREAFAPHVDEDRPGQHAGYGWNVIETPRGQVITHAGDLGGYNAEVRWYPDRGLFVAFLSNARVDGAGWREAVLNPLSLLVAGEPVPEPPTVTELAPGALDPWAGRYVLEGGGALEAVVDGGALVLSAESQEAMTLLAGTPPELAARAEELDERAARIAEASARGDDGPLREALSPSLPYEALAPELDAVRADHAGRLGALASVEVVGTAVRSPSSAETWVRVRYAGGASLSRYAWSGDAILGLDTDLDRPLPTRFLPESPTAVVAFDPFSGRLVRAGLEGDALAFGGGHRASRAG